MNRGLILPIIGKMYFQEGDEEEFRIISIHKHFIEKGDYFEIGILIRSLESGIYYSYEIEFFLNNFLPFEPKEQDSEDKDLCDRCSDPLNLEALDCGRTTCQSCYFETEGKV